MKILVCGFEPFGQREENNAWEVVRRYEGADNIDVLKIPVSFERAHNVVIDVLNRNRYDFVIMVGETSFTPDNVRLERLAINYKDSIKPDNDGIFADDEEIITSAPKAYFTSFPVKKICEKIKERGHKIKVTNSTGTFVCNSLYFNILHYIEIYRLTTKALFIHVPAITEELSLDEIKNTIDEVIKITSFSLLEAGMSPLY